MPHTCNMQNGVVEYSPTIHIQEMSAIRISLSFENFHIFIVGQCEKHFLYVCNPADCVTKIETFSEKCKKISCHSERMK